MNRGLALLLIALSLVCGARTAVSGASDWVREEYVSVRMISAESAVAGEAATLGLEFDLAENWKIYWRSPGDAGFPPQVDWTGSENLAAANIRWPVPERFSAAGFETIGYKHRVVLPIDVRIADPGRGLALRSDVDFLACDEICIPYKVALALDLPSGAAATTPNAALIDDFLARVPAQGSAAGLSLEPLVAVTGGARPVLIASAQAPDGFDSPDLFVEGPTELIFGKPRVVLAAAGRQARFEVPVDGTEDLGGDVLGTEVVVTLADGGRGVERRVSLTAPDAGTIALQPEDATAGLSVLAILGLALLGGLILNLMPCVLPVLSIKLLGVVRHGGGDPREVRWGFVASAAGIVATFVILAAVLVGLKTAGAAVGWGIQFQHPWFLAAMALLVTLFACNLWGLFEIRLPGAVADLGAEAMPVRGLGGHFLTGVLATLLATPCSAPFLGTAVGFALARGALDILAVFVAVGIGLALPYLLVAAVPVLATRLPRPGPWMLVLKKVLAVALAGTAVWLVTVMAAQMGSGPSALAAAVLVAVAGVFILARRESLPRRAAPWAVGVLAAVLFLVSALGSDARRETAADGPWTPFDEARLAQLVAAGETVFVDVTADWCLTCQVNKAAVLSVDPVRASLEAPGVTAMQADWTLPDAEIADYLAGFGRYGIPFNAVYGPRAPTGLPLPELLTDGLVMEALAAAAGEAPIKETKK